MEDILERYYDPSTEKLRSEFTYAPTLVRDGNGHTITNAYLKKIVTWNSFGGIDEIMYFCGGYQEGEELTYEYN